MADHANAPKSGLIGGLASLLVGLPGVMCLGYAILTRTVYDFVWHTAAIGVVVATIIAAAAVDDWWRTGFKRPTLWEVVAVAIAALFLGLVFYVVGVSVKDGFLFLRDFSHTKPGTAAALAFGSVGIGLFLFAVRYYFRATYGLTEAVVGVWIAYRSFAPSPPGATPVDRSSTAFYLTLLTAALYLMVRGFDNIQQGLTRDPKDKLALEVIARIRRHSFFVSGKAATPPAEDAGSTALAKPATSTGRRAETQP